MTEPSSQPVSAPFDALQVPLLDGATLIEASAGTGKTFAITRLVLRLLLERRVSSLSQILVVTFTEKATQELVTRLRGVLRQADRVWSQTPPARDAANDDLFVLHDRHGADGAAIIRGALGSLDDLGVSTIHGFCQRMLAESALETRQPFRTTFVEDETEPLVRAAMDWMRRRILTDGPAAAQLVDAQADIGAMVDKYVRRFRRQPGTVLDFDPFEPAQALVADFIHSVDHGFNREKSRRHLLGFDDLLRTLSTVLTAEGPEGPLAVRIRTRYRAALIDEFQDTDSTQFPIFSTAFHGCPLFLIGDPKQSIYGFRGADIRAYFSAAEGAARRYTLTRNYRSTPAYVNAADRLFTRAPNPFRYEQAPIGFPLIAAATTPVPPPALAADGRGAMVWWWLDKSLGKNGKYIAKDLALTIVVRAVSNEIVRLAAARLPYRSIAVLVRTNSEATAIKGELTAAGVPAVVGGAADVLESDEASELVRLAAAISSPYDARAIASALATRLWGCDAAEIARLASDTGDAGWSRVTERFAEIRELWRARGVSAAIGSVLIERRTAERLLTLPDGERRMTNVRHVVELLHEASAADGLVLESVGAWLARELSVSNTPERRQQRLETDGEAVQILTIHKAKGLEFDVVFCPTLWSERTAQKAPLNLIPATARDARGYVLDIGSTSHAQRLVESQHEDDAEAQRLAYVALTRAVHRCYIAFGEIGMREAFARSPIGYLLRPTAGESALGALQTMVAASDGTMSFQALERDAAQGVSPVVSTHEPGQVATTLELNRAQLDTWRLSSFTSLVADAPDGPARDVADVTVLAEGAEIATGFRAFPAGTRAGIALHDVFERLDFARASDTQTRSMVRRSLVAHGLSGRPDEVDTRIDDVTGMLERVCRATLPGTGFSLADVPGAAAMREWRFDLSVATTSPRRVADALAAHGSSHAQEYAPLLRTLRESAMPGYLSGVIDLAFEQEGRWWIVDWKSNQLGATDERYAAEVLGDVMMQSHYTLQYHLYLVALHRHLSVRQPGYDPNRHLGGVAYVFLRGVDGTSSRGWFHDTPTAPLLDALDAALGRRT